MEGSTTRNDQNLSSRTSTIFYSVCGRKHDLSCLLISNQVHVIGFGTEEISILQVREKVAFSLNGKFSMNDDKATV